ncbi:LysE family translocator [Tabrizicola flagellatus]|uniref:LysE family translocator n=1 Tax=Tabrizicola flagellatus TaxID=2593021 RepID=UPI0011F40043|nr:LysE family translocator [Tabrizicola flagellatus]
MDADALLSFLLTALVLELTPGPNMAWLALLAATSGPQAGLAAVLGITLGLAVQALLAATGVAVVVAAWPGLFQALHIAGVAYLLYLALESWRDAGNPAHHLPGGGEDGAAGFRRGLVTNLLNPKAALMFVTVLPGFLTVESGAWESAVLSAIYLVVAVVVHLMIVALAGTLRGPLADPVVSARMHRVQAMTLAAVAAWLLGRG